MMRTFFGLTVAAGFAFLSVSSAQVNVEGTWLSADFNNPVTITFTVQNSTVTGRIGPVPIENGRIDGDTIVFTASPPTGGRVATFTGKVLGDRIAFTRSVRVIDPRQNNGNGPAGAFGPMEFVATRQAENRFFNSDGVPIRYVEQGDGEPIVLAHGVGGSVDVWLTSVVMGNLTKDHRVIAFDWRGHGRSGKPHDPNAYGPEMARDVVRLLDHLGISRAHVIGHSMGASLTSLLLTLHPDRFLTAVLIAGAGQFEWTSENARDAEQGASERERECISRSLILRLAPPNVPPPSEEDIKARSAACFADTNVDLTAMAALTRGGAGRVVDPARASAVKVPTLGIVGSLDPSSLANLERLKAFRPDLRLIVIPNADHNGILSSLELLTSIREFIAMNRRSSLP